MAFVVKKILDQNADCRIAARLFLQTAKILELCDLTKDVRDAISKLCLESLSRKLLRCREIEQRVTAQYVRAVENFKPPKDQSSAVELPQIERIEEDFHNFLYEAKNYLRDTLQIINHLHGTNFAEASEILWSKKGELSLVDWVQVTLGAKHSMTRIVGEVRPSAEVIIPSRNAVEHPGGHSGTLKTENIMLGLDGTLTAPVFYRVQDGESISPVVPVCIFMDATINDLLHFGEEITVAWVADHLIHPAALEISKIEKAQRDAKVPIKFAVMPRKHN